MKKQFWFRPLVLAALIVLHLSSFSSQSYGAAGDVDLSFNAGLGFSGPVQAVAVQPDGKVLVGGSLTFINGTNRYGSARLNPDGSPDSTFVPATFNAVVGDLGVPHDPASLSDSVRFTAFALQSDVWRLGNGAHVGGATGRQGGSARQFSGRQRHEPKRAGPPQRQWQLGHQF